MQLWNDALEGQSEHKTDAGVDLHVFARALEECGHDVRMRTSVPNDSVELATIALQHSFLVAEVPGKSGVLNI